MRPLLFLVAGIVSVAVSFFASGYLFGQIAMMRRMRRRAALQPAPVASLEGASDVDLFGEMLARALRKALCGGDLEQVAHIREAGEHIPPVRERLAAVLAEMPVITGPRGQA